MQSTESAHQERGVDHIYPLDNQPTMDKACRDIAPRLFHDLSTWLGIQAVDAPQVYSAQDLREQSSELAQLKTKDLEQFVRRHSRMFYGVSAVATGVSGLFAGLVGGALAAGFVSGTVLGVTVALTLLYQFGLKTSYQSYIQNRLLQVYTDNVTQGLYLRRNRSIYMIQLGVHDADIKATLAHEMTHYLQHHFWGEYETFAMFGYEWLIEGMAEAVSLEWLLQSSDSMDQCQARFMVQSAFRSIATAQMLDEFSSGDPDRIGIHQTLRLRAMAMLLIMEVAHQHGDDFYPRVIKGDFSVLEHGLAEFMGA